MPLPPDWTGDAAAANLVKVGSRVYYRAIERKFPGVLSVQALLIEPREPRGDQPGPFYMMRDKVWVGLFDRFLQDHPKYAPKPAPANDDAKPPAEPPDPLLPVMNVSGIEAQAFAEWLGGKGHGFLPTTRQWEQAAGYNLTPRPRGPFRDDDDSPAGSWRGIAVGNHEKPLPIGSSLRDVSRYGCRDMAGNGYEWTRLPEGKEPDFEISLRGQSYDVDEPYLFKKQADYSQALRYRDRGDHTGFRIVIELGPEP